MGKYRLAKFVYSRGNSSSQSCAVRAWYKIIYNPEQLVAAVL